MQYNHKYFLLEGPENNFCPKIRFFLGINGYIFDLYWLVTPICSDQQSFHYACQIFKDYCWTGYSVTRYLATVLGNLSGKNRMVIEILEKSFQNLLQLNMLNWVKLVNILLVIFLSSLEPQCLESGSRIWPETCRIFNNVEGCKLIDR